MVSLSTLRSLQAAGRLAFSRERDARRRMRDDNASGAVVWPTRKGLPPFRPIENRGGSVAVAVIEERDEGVTLD
jgi:hypothetical protein